MSFRTLSMVGAAVLWGASLAAAATVTFTGAGNRTAFGVHVGPYTATVDGQPITMVCVDWNNHVSRNQVWTANLTELSPATWSTGVDQTRFGRLRPSSQTAEDVRVRYLQAAWLALQFFDATVARREWDDIHAAIWSLFATNGPTAAHSSLWRQRAETSYDDLNLDSSYVITQGPASSLARTGQIQEFLVPVIGPDDAPVPEPTTALLLGSALVGLALLRKRHQP